MEKINLYKFTYIPLLKNDAQLKQKSDKQPKNKTKYNHPNLLYKKKSCLKKKKKNENKNQKLIKIRILKYY